MASEASRTHVNHRLARAVREALVAASVVGFASGAHAADLPVPCIVNCGANSSGFVESGIATVVTNGATLNVQQTTDSAVLHWSGFNVGAGHTVNFQQPSSTATALNRIHQTDPSRIFGALNANGRVFLLNRNGVLFGENSRVNVGGLLATSLDIAPDVLANGLTSATAQSRPALTAYTDDTGELLSGHVLIERGAEITTSEGGQVLIFAPQVTNEGTIRTPGGQALLAAGAPIYLTTSDDPGLRGLLVEVGAGGVLTNGVAANGEVDDPTRMVGQIIAERGNVTLAGLAVNQQGRVSATTTVRANGSIRLQARDGGGVSGGGRLQATSGGTLTLAQGSVTDVKLAGEDAAVDASEQLSSRIELQGHRVNILGNAEVLAHGGVIKASARANPGASYAAISERGDISGLIDDGSRIYVGSGARLDVSGADEELAMERNVVRAELRGDELANSPAQRDGALRSQPVFVDVRASGTRADGSTWRGTPLADVTGQISLIERSVEERNSVGGTVTFESQGDVVLAQGSTIDVSGGVIRYRDGYIATTQVRGADGRIYDIANADPDRTYLGTYSGYTVEHERWGITETFATHANQGRFEAGYVEGKDAGAVQVIAPRAVLDGDIAGEVTVGRHQRQPSQALASTQRYRPHEQLPLSAQLVFGWRMGATPLDRVGGAVRIGGESSTPSQSFDPLHDPLPDDFLTTIRTDLFGVDRIGRLAVHSNETVELPAAAELRLPAQGSLTIAAGLVDIAGRIDAPAGSIELRALQTEATTPPDAAVHLRGTAQIDVRGQWINDSRRLNAPGAQLAPLLIDGGEVSISASGGSVHFVQGALIDASAGAWARANGDIVAGRGGDVTLSVTPDALNPGVAQLFPGGEIRALAMGRGGKLTLQAPAICISVDGQCESPDAFAVTPAQLLSGGFGALTLEATERGLTVESDVQLALRQRNFVLSEAALDAASGARIETFAQIAELPDYERAATDLTLRTSVPRPPLELYNDTSFADVGVLSVERGASIQGDAGARIALESNSSIHVAGAVSAHAGSISLTASNGLAVSELPRSQGVWLDSGARLDVSGVARLEPNELGLRRGEVLDGGSVSLTAQRGAVVVNPESSIDVSGAGATLDIAGAPGSTTDVEARTIVSNGGDVIVTGADAVVLSGEIDAHGGGAGAVGGSLFVTMAADERKGPASQDLLPEVAERRIIVAQQGLPTLVAPGAALPESLAGAARVGAEQIRAAGFSDVTLASNTTRGANVFGGEVVAPGVIEFAGDVTLEVGRSLALDAARLTGDGQVSLAAPYVSIGQRSALNQDVTMLAPEATGELLVQGSLVELIGRSTIDGFDSVRLESSGDLRARGVQRTAQLTVEGGLATSADLTLHADQVYASTLSSFSIEVDGNEGRLRIESTGDERADVLSAGSHLTLSAATIEQAGVVRAPFGSIELRGEDVRLESGSLTSTSAEGALIPFGSIQAGNEWVYGLNAQTLVVGDTAAIPEQRVQLDGERVSIGEGAVVDVSAGGDLLAYEFIPGPTGKRDVLSPQVNPNLFAIVPGLALEHAPFDPQESIGAALSVGDNIHLSDAVDGLPAGDYVLLPARYALLPGAYLVSAASGYTDLAPGAVLPRLDGATIVSGYRASAGTAFTDARTQGFAIRSGAQFAREARYDTARASEFFAAQAREREVARPRLPQDAGILSIAASEQLDIEGTLRAAAGQSGRGAAVDISAQNLVVSNSAQSTDAVVVNAEQLSRLGAESLLLGGRRTGAGEGVAIEVPAQRVTIDGDATLAAPEIILAAADTVQMNSGATLRAEGETGDPDAYIVEGDGALLRIASGAQAEIRRTDESGVAGTLTLAHGARLIAPGGALALDASLDTRSEASLVLPDGALSLGASRINLGAAPEDAAGLTLDDAQLSALGLQELALVSRSTIDLFGDVALNVNELTLDAAGLRRIGDARNASISAGGSMLLTNRADRTSDDAAASAGALALRATNVEIGEGVQRISGFESVTVAATQGAATRDEGGLHVAGDLTIEAPVLLAGGGAQTQIEATGDLRVAAAGSAAQAQSAALGGELKLTGRSIDVSTRIEAAAGEIELVATEDMTLVSGAVLDVAGRTRDFDGVLVAAAGGDVRLTATGGDVIARDGSTIDFSGAASGGAGSLAARAAVGSITLTGALDGAAQSASDSGRVQIDAASVGSLDALNATLNSGGVYGARVVRQRGAGDLEVGQTQMRAERVVVTADQGDVIVSGQIDARGAEGGKVVLSARDSVLVNGSILANAQAVYEDGGRVALRTTSADAGEGVQLGASARIDVSGGMQARDGEVDVRASRAAVMTLADADASNDAVRLGNAVSGARQVDLEAFAVYVDADNVLMNGQITTSTIARTNPIYTQAVELMSNEAAILAGLGRTDDETFRLLPGVEIQAASDMALATNWDLSTWRFGANNNRPGVLTLRATGDLTMNGSLSDGFRGVSGAATSDAFRLAASPSDSWSYRLIAGADASSADVMAIEAGADGDFGIAPGNASASPQVVSTFRMVRTGNGSIDVAAAGDFRLGNRASVLYTAGVADVEGQRLGSGFLLLGGRAYPTDGGDITIDVGGDVIGFDPEQPASAHNNQLVTDWLWRVGRAPNERNGAATAWTVNFARFEQNVGALGGGDVSIAAGGDIIDFSASIPSIGRPSARFAGESELTITGGGDLTVRAAGDIRGGSYYVGRGTGVLAAGGDIAQADTPTAGSVVPLFPVLALGDGEWRAVARGSAGVESVVNPTLLPQGRSQAQGSGDSADVHDANRSTFATYTEDSTVVIQAVGGNAALSNDAASLARWFGPSMARLNNDPERQVGLRVYAPNLQAASLSGDVTVDRGMTLFPAAGSSVQLFAENDIERASPNISLDFLQSDADPTLLPSISAPHDHVETLYQALFSAGSVSRSMHAETPVHSGDTAISRLVARTGDISFEKPADMQVENASALSFSTPVRVIAGGDIVELPLSVQHDDPNDLTTILAGGDIRYTVSRRPDGGVQRNDLGIDVSGPGTVQLVAGGDVDLQTSRGVTTLGNLGNSALPKQGASISVLAGLNGLEPRLAEMTSRYLELGSGHDSNLIAYIEARTGEDDLDLEDAQKRLEQFGAYRRDLVAFVEARSGRSGVTEAEALELFRGLSDSQRRELLDRVLLSELRVSGREAATTGSGDFARAYTALETLYPGSNPDAEAGERNAYAGDIALYFSRIYALAGGDISLFAPGGEINTGLATPPASFGLDKSAAELGVVVRGPGDVNAVAYGDFQVNESRVFAADGGDIMVWSTDGDIDAGRGAKTAISAPPPTVTFDENGAVNVDFPLALAGSGIQTLATSDGVEPGDVDLFAPRGVVNAGDAGIVAGNLTIAATAVLGADNIQVSGVAVGVPVDTGGLGASLAGVSNVASSATSAAAASVEASSREPEERAPLADTAMSWLDVFVVGLGEGQCDPKDLECLKRQDGAGGSP